MKTYTEDAFEQLIVERLVLHGGYEPRGRTPYDPDDALASVLTQELTSRPSYRNRILAPCGSA